MKILAMFTFIFFTSTLYADGQYVDGYQKSNGTYVSGYVRSGNSASDDSITVYGNSFTGDTTSSSAYNDDYNPPVAEVNGLDINSGY